MRKKWKFSALWYQEQWLQPAYITTNDQGKITEITTTPQIAPTEYIEIKGIAVPGYGNAHSHAFQYAMAATAEHLPPAAKQDDFWSWRQAMYNLALKLSPEQVESIATMLYLEMLKNGYTHVVEFHYLHHNISGQAYSDPAEMAARILQAATKVGIKLTLLPVFYQKGGFDQPPSPEQRRFVSSNLEQYHNLLSATKQHLANHPTANYGVAVHSLRAAETQHVKELWQLTHNKKLPFHIHVAEQQKEVAACQQHLGTRPVQWLLDHLALDENSHLVHATHITPEETKQLAQSPAHVVLCPSTEGNLGDGFFPLQDFWQQGGNWSIGTDSHIGLNPNEELRILDYGGRLRQEKRNILCRKGGDNSGHLAYQQSFHSGRQAAGRPEEKLAIGQPLDLAVYDALSPLLGTTSSEHLHSTIVYTCDRSHLLGTMVSGNWVVEKGLHSQQEEIHDKFFQTCRELQNR